MPAHVEPAQIAAALAGSQAVAAFGQASVEIVVDEDEAKELDELDAQAGPDGRDEVSCSSRDMRLRFVSHEAALLALAVLEADVDGELATEAEEKKEAEDEKEAEKEEEAEGEVSGEVASAPAVRANAAGVASREREGQPSPLMGLRALLRASGCFVCLEFNERPYYGRGWVSELALAPTMSAVPTASCVHRARRRARHPQRSRGRLLGSHEVQ